MTDAQDRGHTPAGGSADSPRPPRRKSRVLAYVLVAVLALPLAAQARYLGWNIFDEGRDVAMAVTTLSDSIVESFAADHAAGGSVYYSAPVPCTSPPPWAPNRVMFLGRVEASLPASTDRESVLELAAEKASELGIASQERSLGYLYLDSPRGTRIRVTLVEGAADRDAILTIGFLSRCLPRPRGYRGGSLESRVAFANDWSKRTGFQSGGLSSARLW